MDKKPPIETKNYVKPKKKIKLPKLPRLPKLPKISKNALKKAAKALLVSAAALACAALAFAVKLVVSAEVLAYTPFSLGGMMQDAKIYELPQLFALVAVTFLVGLLLEMLVGLLAEWVEKKVK